MKFINANKLHRKSGGVGYSCSFPLTLDSPHALSGDPQWNPTSREKRARCPDFLYAAPSNVHVCGFH
jgi:hypothetical protein